MLVSFSDSINYVSCVSYQLLGGAAEGEVWERATPLRGVAFERSRSRWAKWRHPSSVSLYCIGLYVDLLAAKLIRFSISTDISDHFDVKMSLDKLGPHQLTDLGGALGLSYPKMMRMPNILDDVSTAWLNREDQVLEKSGEPTWSRLVDALEKIGQRGIAEDIRNNKSCGKTDINPSRIEGKFCKTVATIIMYNHAYRQISN